MGLNVWLTCFCESLHTKHTGCLSSRQKSLSFSLCELQISSDPDERLSFLSFRNDSHKFLNARLNGGGFLEDLLLQTGHSWDPLVLQNCWRHSLQKLWLHDKTTGALKISQHTGQESSSAETFSEAIFTVWAPAETNFSNSSVKFPPSYSTDRWFFIAFVETKSKWQKREITSPPLPG